MKKKNNPDGVSTTPYFKKVKALNLVNENTGEIYPDGSTVNVATDLVIISYDEYVIFNSDALNYIRKNFKPAIFNIVMSMADMTQEELNVICDENRQPHNSKTLAIALEYSTTRYYKLMKILYSAGIIHYHIGFKDGVERKTILLNPYVARKRKTIHKSLSVLFSPLR